MKTERRHWREWVLLAMVLLVMGLEPTQAQLLDDDTIFLAGMEGETIEPLFPEQNGQVVLPAHATGSRLQWIIDELAAGEATTQQEIQDNFISGFDPASMQSFFNDTLRPLFPDATITDLIGITDIEATLVWDSPGGQPQAGFVVLRVDFAGDQKINFFQVSNFGGTVQFPGDQMLNLEQAADAFQALNTDNSLLIAYLDDDNICVPIVERQANISRATGSLFKTWVLGAVANDIADGSINVTDPVPLVASEMALGAAINNVPLGTVFTVQQMSTLMMANSDNTATDHLHELVGRVAVGEFIQNVGLAQPDEVLPLLSVSEQFHLFFSFPLVTSESYVFGTEAFQQQFLDSQIVPLGPTFPPSQPFFHTDLLTSGSWRASPMDLCRTLAGLRDVDETNGGFDLVKQAMGAQAAQPNVRGLWNRVWYKGGSLASGAGLHVLTHGWLLENGGESPPIVLIAMANADAGGIDQFAIQSLTNRMIEVVRTMVP